MSQLQTTIFFEYFQRYHSNEGFCLITFTNIVPQSNKMTLEGSCSLILVEKSKYLDSWTDFRKSEKTETLFNYLRMFVQNFIDIGFVFIKFKPFFLGPCQTKFRNSDWPSSWSSLVLFRFSSTNEISRIKK